MSIHLLSINNLHEHPPRLALPPPSSNSLLWGSRSFRFIINRIKMSRSLFFFFFLVTTAAFSNFKSSSSSQSPSNGISINLLNGFKKSLALMRVSKTRTGPGTHGPGVAELVLFHSASAPTGGRRLMKLMGLAEAANPRFYWRMFESRAELMTASPAVHAGERD